jgi:CHAT domain-containing protein
LDKSIITAVSKPPVERNQTMEDQIRKRIGEIKSERNALLEVFKQRFPDYVALSKPQPLTVEETQALLTDDEAVVIIDLDQKSYIWVITKDRAEWRELSVSADDVSKEVGTLRIGLNPDAPRPFDRKLAYQLYQQLLQPIEEIISPKERLSFVLDGPLTSLPPQVRQSVLHLSGCAHRTTHNPSSSCSTQARPPCQSTVDRPGERNGCSLRHKRKGNYRGEC